MENELVMAKVCHKCGGEIEEGAPGQKYVICPFCRTKYKNPNADVKDKAGHKRPSDFPYFDPAIFDEKWEYPMIRQSESAFEVVNEISECLERYATSGDVLNYILDELSDDTDFAAEGIHENLLNKVKSSVNSQLAPGEKILYYVDDAILFMESPAL